MGEERPRHGDGGTDMHVRRRGLYPYIGLRVHRDHLSRAEQSRERRQKAHADTG
jgi:hypothetical protein